MVTGHVVWNEQPHSVTVCGVAGGCGSHRVQEMALPADSMPAEKNSPNSPARRSSGRGSLLRGSLRRNRCAAMLTSSSAGSPLAFTWA